MQTKANAMVLQSGGPTAVINKSLYGVYSSWQKQRPSAKIYGSLFGVSGILENKIIDLTSLDPVTIEKISNSPSAALGSARYNLRAKTGPKDLALYKIFAVFSRLNIGFCFLIGGDDSRKNADTIYKHARKIGYELVVIFIPKTIDNDLTFTHHCPGFASAAKFIAMAVTGIDLDNRAIPGLMINIVMGRNVGWLAASSVVAKKNEKMGPHLIYLPESNFSIPNFISDIENAMSRFGRANLVVAEGISEKPCIVQYLNEIHGTEFLSQLCGVDDFGHVQLSGNGIFGAILCHIVKTKTRIKRIRVNTFDYLQRSFPLFSKIDQRQAFEVGAKAVDSALKGEVNNAMVAIGTDDFRYNDEIRLVPLEEVFKNVKHEIKTVPGEVIADGNQISSDFLIYMGPLAEKIPAVDLLF